jgi:hypothetical protein
MTCKYVYRLGVLALGARDPLHGADVERHLRHCVECQDEYIRLAALPPLLATVTAADVDLSGPPADPAPELLDRVIDAVVGERQKRRHRVLIAGAATALVVAAAAALGALAWPSAPEEPRSLAADSRFGVDATSTVVPKAWGTSIAMTLRGLTPGTSCRLVVHARDGRKETVGSWRVTYENAVQVEGMTALRFDELTDVEVVDSTDRSLVTVSVPTRDKASR